MLIQSCCSDNLELVKYLINTYNYSVKSLRDLEELNDLAHEEKNESVINEILENRKSRSAKLRVLERIYT